MKIIVMQGLPGSGKTTVAKEICQDTSYVRVCRDDIREMFGVYWVPSREDLVTEVEKTTIIKALDKGYNVVVDATNFNPKTLNRISDIATHPSFIDSVEVEIKFINTPVEECIRRDKLRTRQVGEKVIIDFAKKYLNYIE